MNTLEVTCWLPEGEMRGGGALACRELAGALLRRGAEVRIFCGDYSQTIAILNNHAGVQCD